MTSHPILKTAALVAFGILLFTAAAILKLLNQ